MAQASWLTLSASLLLLLARGTAVGLDDPSLKDLLRRMAAYAESYGEKASIVVATERYAQHVSGGRPPASGDHRVSVADFAIVKAEGLGGWVGFRDVIEVDGTSLTDRRDRLLKVLTSASGASDEARRLSTESARFNLGPIYRDFNVPTSALFFFLPDNLERFKFNRRSVAADGTWEIVFRETSRPTLIRTPGGRSIPSEGSVWVDAATGTVVRTRLRIKEFAAPESAKPRGAADIDVKYRHVADLDLWLPETMTESYEVMRGTSVDRLTTEAWYSNYRKFQTSVRIK